jgi:short-subunit dehydrogenase
MRDWFGELFSGRPWWMNGLMLFCGYMAIVYVPWDLFIKPMADDQEVWFGILFTGWAAKLTGLGHWFVYGAGAYGFRRMRPWMPTWSALYVAQIAFSMLVWSLSQLGFFVGLLAGSVSAVPFVLLAMALWNARDQFGSPAQSLHDRYGEWALVTGASAGIGAEFARALARQGVSVVLTARREDRLLALAGELEKTYNVETRTIAVDLSKPDGARQLIARLGELPIDILVNNAGLGYAGRFENQDIEKLETLVQVNCTTPMVLTHALLPGMRERRRGAVIITGSVAGRQPLPLHGIYAATKAFDLFLGEALWGELRGSGIDVVVLEPGSTETEFQEVAGEIPHEGESAADVVAVAIEALGRQPSVISGWFNYLRANAVTRLASRTLVNCIAKDVMEKQTPIALR